jgi:hypothetical protein
MPYDPTKPANGSLISSAELRNQFTGLKDLIDAIPPAPPETDPVFAASEAHLFVAGDKAKLDAALTTETEPAFTGSEAALFAAGDKAKLDSFQPPGAKAYSWPSVAIDTTRQPSLTQDTLVIAQVQLNCAGVGAGAANIKVGGGNPPVPQVTFCWFNGTGSVIMPVTFIVKAGEYYRIVNASSGAGTLAAINGVAEFSLP